MADKPMRGHAREAILAEATAQFTALGIRAVSADRVIDGAGVSKVTFYRHFPTKDDLVVAYLEAELERVRSAVERAAAATGSHGLSGALADEICRPGFRGCPFINAAAEYPDADHPVRDVVARFRAWMIAAIREALVSRGVEGADEAARQIMMMRDGALVEGYVTGDAERVARELEAGVAALVASAVAASPG
ncbi:TetR/AcrR family transcriptional regulator [uncultured Demequina sp.]|uniref:TetR/AcrR family transcriptional regulator n=1 Tax=uncultured Demequina sp. TaxID=693499 RepID=UPI0025DFE2E8|nr:TetR/AcrR family transcriptional regulator [uncultured Demequina sp.]